MKHRGTRFRIACALEGYGTVSRKAMEWNVNATLLSHVASGKPANPGGGPRRSYRLETLIDEFIRATFAKHRAVLDLGGEA